MKKLIKICLIVGGILTVLGLGICIAAGTSGWSQLRSGAYRDYCGPFADNMDIWDSENMETVRAEEHMVQSQETAEMIENLEETQMMQQEDPDAADNFLDDEEERYLAEAVVPEQEYSFSNVRNLEIKISGGMVRIVPADTGEDIKVIVGEGTGSYQCYLEEGTLKVMHGQRKKKGSHRIIEIQVPQGVSFSETDIEINGGILLAEKLHSQETDIEINGGVGKILQGTTAYLDIDMNAGIFFMKGDVSGNADVSCNAGQVDLILKGTAEEYGVNCEAFAGTVTVGDETYIGRKEVGRDRTKQLELECAAGMIDIRFQE